MSDKGKCCFCGEIYGALIRLHQGWCCVKCFKEIILREEPETWTLFKFCQNCYTVLTFEAKKCPVCGNPRVAGSCSQVWLRSKGLVDV